MDNQELPEGWELVNIFDICQPKQWKTIAKKDLLDDGYLVYGANGIIGYYHTYNHETETVLLTCRGATCGEVHISKPYSYINGNAMCMDNLSDRVETKYLYYFLKNVNFKFIISGSAQPQITQIGLQKLNILIPPLPQQTAIVNKIESLFSEIDAGIESLKVAQNKLTQYRQSLLKNAFNGELTKQWREENADRLPSAEELLQQIQQARETYYQAKVDEWKSAVQIWEENSKEGKKPSKPVRLKDFTFVKTRLLPAEYYPQVYLMDISDISGGLTKNSKRNTFEENVPYLRVANVYANELNLDDIKTIGILESEKRRTLLQKNDLLIVEGNGSIDQIGRVAIWNDEISPCYHQNHLIKARCYANINPYFVLYFLMSPVGRKIIVDVASSTTGLHTLSLSKVGNLIIPICSLEEQNQIVTILEKQLTQADHFAQEISKQLKLAELLKQSILKAAFSGKLLQGNHE